MKKLMCSQRRFFRSFFPMTFDPQFLLFKNMKTGSLDIVVRSGDIICSVPPIKGRDSAYQSDLARSIIHSLYDSDFDSICDLCCMQKEQAVKELQKEYFGADGVMQQHSSRLLDPIREKVDAAISKVAEKGNYMVILDLASMQGVAYSNPSYDLSAEVIKALGY